MCKNSEYDPGFPLDFRIGVFVFWEVIIPHLLNIASLVGCKYIYLFAADNTEIKQKTKEPMMYAQGCDIYDGDDDNDDGKRVLQLVNYYQNELKFRFVTKYKILKPSYERKCYTLIQKVDELERNRKEVWENHKSDKSKDSSSYKSHNKSKIEIKVIE